MIVCLIALIVRLGWRNDQEIHDHSLLGFKIKQMGWQAGLGPLGLIHTGRDHVSTVPWPLPYRRLRPPPAWSCPYAAAQRRHPALHRCPMLPPCPAPLPSPTVIPCSATQPCTATITCPSSALSLVILVVVLISTNRLVGPLARLANQTTWNQSFIVSREVLRANTHTRVLHCHFARFGFWD
jgi:hypothetical protein